MKDGRCLVAFHMARKAMHLIQLVSIFICELTEIRVGLWITNAENLIERSLALGDSNKIPKVLGLNNSLDLAD